MICYIGLGSNLGKSAQYLQNAVSALHKSSNIQVIATSPVYQSKPQGPQDQPDYLNAVIAIETALSPHNLLQITQQIETDNQRKRDGQRWGARTLDLDILLYGDERINQADLVIPHPWLCQRSFVLYPLRDIAQSLHLPDGKSLQECIDALPDQNDSVLSSISLSIG